MAPETSHDDADDDEPRHAWTWTRSQRRVLAAFLAVLCPVLALRYACNRAYMSDPPPPKGPGITK